jgi:glutamate synthase (ferredoxin)
MRFVAAEMREIMASLGFRTVDEMVGRTDMLVVRNETAHWKAQGIDLSALLYRPEAPAEVGRICSQAQDHGLDTSYDRTTLLALCAPALERGEVVEATLPIRNVHRTVGTILGSEVTRRTGATGLPEDTVRLTFQGSAGQSFAAFTPAGLTFTLEGDANDYLGKGLSGAKVIVNPPDASTFQPEDNIIIGNVAFYGATSGEAYIRGLAGERFCVRNSGVEAVVEGVGDHGCEYMTGGRVAILGRTGRNFAAGMSGGIAYVLDADGTFAERCNLDMVDIVALDAIDVQTLSNMVWRHAVNTGSTLAWHMLSDWDEAATRFVKVLPKDYQRVLNALAAAEAAGLTGEEAVMAAFEANKRDASRVSGN